MAHNRRQTFFFFPGLRHRTAREEGEFLNITSTRFTDTQTLAGRLLQEAHAHLAAGIEPTTLGFRAQVANHYDTGSKDIQKDLVVFQKIDS